MKFKAFLLTKGISEEAFSKLEAEQQAKLHGEFLDTIAKSLDEKADSTQLTELSEKIDGIQPSFTTIEKTELLETVQQLKERGSSSASPVSNVVKALTDNSEKIKAWVAGKTGMLEIEVKAAQNPSDVGNRTDYAMFQPGTNELPFRKFSILDLFRRVPVTKEYVKYREEATVTRDAKVVIACATSTHNTKKTWINRTVQIQKIRDFVDVCIDMIDDYDFVGAEIKKLVEQSVKAKEETEILMGTGDILSIDQIASEFDPTNVLAPFDGSAGTGFQAATLAELTAAMAAQIYTFGQENKWVADSILMNYNDWVRFQHAKNSLGDYLLPNFVYTNGGVLEGMRIVTSPLIAPNTLYVFDGSRGEILDRKQMTIEMYYENRDNAEHEIVTIKAVERMQFHVKLIDQDAFMKCSDIATALVGITNVNP